MPTDGQRSLVTLATTILTIIAIAILYWARSLFIPIALAIFLTFVLSPLVAWLQHRGLGRMVSVIIVVALVLFGTMAISGVIAHEIVKIADSLPDRKEAIKEKIVTIRNWFTGDGQDRFSQMIDDLAKVISPRSENQTVVLEPASLPAQLQPYISPSAEILGQIALTVVLTIYMLIRREDLRNRMIRLLGNGKVTTTTKAVDEASRRISHYLLVQLAINAIFGLLISLGLLVIGVQYVLLWGFIAGVMRYVPYIGTWIGLIPLLLFSFATSPPGPAGWGQLLAVFLLYLCLELLCANVLEPWLYGSSMGLSSVALLIATAFWAYLWGPIGLILASPLTACLLVLGKYVQGASFLEVILGDQPPLTPSIAFYQRLAARDQDEAAEVAHAAAKSSSPEAALEQIVVPALIMTRRDRDRGELDQAAFQFAIDAAREIATELEEMREPAHGDAREERVRLLVCPARDEAENIAAEILAAVLEPGKWDVRLTGDAMLASEMITAIEEFHPEVIVLIALPPGGLSHCRYLMKRIRSKFRDTRVIVGRWGDEEESGQSPNGLTGVDALDRSLTGTLRRLTALHPVLLADIEKRNAEMKQEAKSKGPQPVIAKPTLDRNVAGSGKTSEERPAQGAPTSK